MPPPTFVHTDGGDAHAAVFAAAVVVSVALHATLGWFARTAKVELPGGPAALTAAQRLALRAESAIRARFDPGLLPPPPPADPADGAAVAERAAADAPAEALSSVDVSAPSVLFEPPPVSASPTGANGADDLSAPPAPAAELPENPTPWQPREEILEIASRFANDDLATLPRREIPAIERVAGVPDVVPETRLAAAVEAAVARGAAAPAWTPPPPGRAEVRVPESALDPSDEADSFAEGALEEAPEPETPPEAYFAEPPEDVAPAAPIENVLDASIEVYRPRRDDGYVYFEVEVRRKGEDVLPPIPRDVLLAQDTSRSIAPQHLHQCREALKSLLSSGFFTPSDRIEVMAFNTTNAWAFGGSWRPATPETLAAAATFVDGIRPGGNTDLYAAVGSALQLPRDPRRATLVLVISDGVATAGGIQRDSEIIGAFSRRNDGGVSVFDVGVSSRSDDYLLSMLSFCNRGGPAALAKDRFEIPKTVRAALETAGTPVLSDIRFSFDTASRAVVTPAMTENLYLERPLRIWGRAPVGTREVTFQALGRNGDRRYDMVFNLSLGDPKPGAGDPSVAKDWARTRIYDLVAEHIRTGDESALSEMAALGRAHSIRIPFPDRFR